MTRRFATTLLVSVFLLLLVVPAKAYEVEVHAPMTLKAFDRLQVDFRTRIGVTREYNMSGKSLGEWMAEGARDEDRKFPQVRPLNHFLDPIHDGKGLRIPYSCSELGSAADDWALDPAGVHGNFYSLP